MIERIKYGGIDNPFNYSEFTCDTILDLNNLPTNKEKGINNLETCSIGSKAIVIENRSQYILNGRNQWVLLKDYKNVGGGSNLEIDETLTLSGYAADAKIVGDKINIINETLDNTKEEVTQARVDADGTTYATLKERLDSTDENVEKIESVSTELKGDLADVKKTTLHLHEVQPTKQYTGVRIRNTDGKFVIGTTGKVKAFSVINGKKYTITLNNNDVFRIAYHDNLHDGSKNITSMTLVYAEDTASVYSFDNQYGNGYIYICYTFSDSEELSVLVEQTDGILEISPNETTFMEYISLETENLLQLEDRVIVNASNKSTGELGLSILPGSIVVKNNKIDISMRLDEWGTSARRIVLKKFDILKAGTYTLSIQNHTFVGLCGMDIWVSKGLPLDANDNRLAKVSANYDVRSSTFTLEEETADVYVFLLMYGEYSVPYCSFYLQLEEGETYTKYVNPNDGNYWVDEKSYNVAMHSQQKITEMYMSGNSKDNMAWTYGWTNPYVIRANRKIFLGYIRKNCFLNKYYAGVTCIDSTGNTVNIDLVESNICDDHNAAAVILTPKNKILVGCSTGHGYDNKVHIVRFRESFQLLGGYDMITIELDDVKYPEAKTSYSQFIKASNGRIIIIFRVQMPEQNTIWAMSYSDDDGITWSETLPFCNMNKYMMVRQRNDDKCALIVGSHPTHEPYNQVLFGYVDFVTGKAYGKDGKTVRSDNIYDGGFELIEKDGVDTIINGIAVRRRLIDYYPSDIGKECILFANATDDSNDDFVYYLYNGNETKELVHSGKAFYTPSSYIGGGCIVDQNTVIVSRNNNDGTWDIVKCIISNDNVSEEIIAHDDVMLLRPLHIHGMVIYQSGEYIDGTFNNWSLDAQIELIN